MAIDWTGLMIGAFFGAALFLGGLADPDKIIGTLRLKDLHAMRTIILFVVVGMIGVWALDLFGLANFSVKPTALISVLIGGALLGVGFGLTGYCPGTGLACAASGRTDAMITVLGMFVGAMVFIFIYPFVVEPIDVLANYGKIMLPEVTKFSRTALVFIITAAAAVAIFFTFQKTRSNVK